MYNKALITFDFCDILNNLGLGKCYQPRPSASADNTYLDLALHEKLDLHKLTLCKYDAKKCKLGVNQKQRW